MILHGGVEPDRSGGPFVAFLVGTGLCTLANGTFNLLVGPTVAARGHTELVIGAVVAVGSATSLLLRVPAGNAFRSERVTVLIVSASLLAGVGDTVLPFASDPAALAALSAVQGAGFAVATTVGMAALLERRRPGTGAASIMGWYTGSIGAGYALAGFVGGPLADAAGLGGALAASGITAVLSGWVTVASLRRLPPQRAEGGEPTRLRGWVRGMPTGVWLGTAIAVYINVVNGGLNAFFPLYGLAIGLTLTQIGVLSGVHATLASTIRFGAGTFLDRVSYRTVIVATVTAMSLAVSAVAVPTAFLPLIVLLAGIGLGRGILRVVSGALVMESAGPSDRHRGRASGIYLAGLDLGNAVGPLIGGVVAETAGVRGSFPVLGLASAGVFLAIRAVAFRRMGPAAGRPRPITPEAP